MNNTQATSPLKSNNKQIKKRLMFYIILSTAILFGISCFLLSPLYVIMSSDVLFQGNILIDLINIFNQISYILVYAVCFSTIIYSLYHFNTKSSILLIAVYCIAVLLRYIINIIVQAIIDGAFPLITELSPVLYNYILELITVFGVVVIAHLVFYTKKDEKKGRKKFLPFSKFYSHSNLLQRSSLYVGIFLAILKIITRIVYDLGYGAPTDIYDLLRMITYYISDLLICLIIYLLSLLVIINIDKKIQSI